MRNCYTRSKNSRHPVPHERESKYRRRDAIHVLSVSISCRLSYTVLRDLTRDPPEMNKLPTPLVQLARIIFGLRPPSQKFSNGLSESLMLLLLREYSRLPQRGERKFTKTRLTKKTTSTTFIAQKRYLDELNGLITVCNKGSGLESCFFVTLCSFTISIFIQETRRTRRDGTVMRLT